MLVRRRDGHFDLIESPETQPVAKRVAAQSDPQDAELVIITGLSGSGKGTVLKAFEDLGYYAVDNLPIELIPKFAELAKDSAQSGARRWWSISARAPRSRSFPRCSRRIAARTSRHAGVSGSRRRSTLVRRFSETRRPHPLGTGQSVAASSLRSERERLAPIRSAGRSHHQHSASSTCTSCAKPFSATSAAAATNPASWFDITSFGYRHGVPPDSDLVFDVRFLPNPNYIPAVQESHRASIPAWRATSARFRRPWSSSSASPSC